MASTDDIETVKAFAKKNEAQFPILSDPEGLVAGKYGVIKFGRFASRTTFIIDDEGTIANINKKVNPVSAGFDLRQNLEVLQRRKNGE